MEHPVVVLLRRSALWVTPVDMTSQPSNSNTRLKTNAFEGDDKVESTEGPAFRLTRNEAKLVGIAGVCVSLTDYSFTPSAK